MLSTHKGVNILLYFYLFIYLVFLPFSRATPVAHGGSQAKGLIRAGAVGLRQSHNKAISELCLQPTPQLTATLDPEPTEQGQGSKPSPQGY